MLVTASDDKLVKLWSVKGYKFLQTFSGHQNWAKSAQFSSDSRMVASGGDDRTVRIWDVSRGCQIHQFNDHMGMVNKVQFHPDSTCIASCANDKKIKIFDARSHRLLQHYDAHDGPVNSISFNQAGTHLISSGSDGVVKVWDLRRGCILYTLFGHIVMVENPVSKGIDIDNKMIPKNAVTTAASFSPNSDYFLSGGTDNVVNLWSSALNPVPMEDLGEIQAKQETDVFVTEKEKVDKLPSARGAKKPALKPKKRRVGSPSPKRIEVAEDEQPKNKAFFNGMTYKKLTPEAKQTLEKIVYQLELVGKTLQVLESRIIDSEDKLQMIMNHIKRGDIDFVSYLSINLVQ